MDGRQMETTGWPSAWCSTRPKRVDRRWYRSGPRAPTPRIQRVVCAGVRWHKGVSPPRQISARHGAISLLGWVGGWGPRYLGPKRERGPARVSRLLSEGKSGVPVDLFDLEPWKDMVTSHSLAGRLVLSLVTRTCQPVLRGRRATAPSTPWWLGVGVPSPLLGDLNVVE